MHRYVTIPSVILDPSRRKGQNFNIATMPENLSFQVYSLSNDFSVTEGDTPFKWCRLPYILCDETLPPIILQLQNSIILPIYIYQIRVVFVVCKMIFLNYIKL